MPTPTNSEYDIEVLGTCTTNPTPGSQDKQTVDAKYLWSYAQEEALVALSEQAPDKSWRLVTDPERRARRIAGRYADLYFKSADKTRGKVQMYWVALAAFVVKDIVEAYRYSREEVMRGGWKNLARTSSGSSIASELLSNASPYEHVQRVYAALAKGNLWLFMDIYPWLWFFLEYGVKPDGTLDEALLKDHVTKRDAGNLQQQSKTALENLPFSANWMSRLSGRIDADPVYAASLKYFSSEPQWGGMEAGYGAFAASAAQAHAYVRSNVKSYDAGYRFPPSNYWSTFDEAFYIMEEERRELRRVMADSSALGKLQKVAQFKVTPEVQAAYAALLSEATASDKAAKFQIQKQELNIIAKQEQINILQPVIYDDAKLGQTMGLNHFFARLTNGLASPYYAVVFSAAPHTSDSNFEAVFDKPQGAWDWVTGRKKSLPNVNERMEYVAAIAKKFNGLMETQRPYMEGELQKIRGWLNA